MMKQVLHMDRNDYYGGESTSLNLVQVGLVSSFILSWFYFLNILTKSLPIVTWIWQLWKRFRGNDKPPAHLGSSRDYNVDMIPKVAIPLLLLLYNLLASFDNPVCLQPVYDGKWNSRPGPYSYRCHQIFVFQGSGWQLRF